jgi:hypothetical protein
MPVEREASPDPRAGQIAVIADRRSVTVHVWVRRENVLPVDGLGNLPFPVGAQRARTWSYRNAPLRVRPIWA